MVSHNLPYFDPGGLAPVGCFLYLREVSHKVKKLTLLPIVFTKIWIVDFPMVK